MNNDMSWLTARAEEFAVRRLADVVLADSRFAEWTGSSEPRKHHFGDGGLLRHTREVVELALNALKTLGGDERDARLLYLAALFHDYGKVLDYERGGPDGWRKSPHGKLVYHVSRSAFLFEEAVRATSTWLGDEDQMAVTHAILAHHGQPAWGSPVTPQTKLAWLLHLADSMSARWDDCGRKTQS